MAVSVMKEGLSIASPFSHGVGVLPRNQSQNLATDRTAPARVAVVKALNGIGSLGLALHTAMRRGCGDIPWGAFGDSAVPQVTPL
jgi:hypothetical protein